MVERETSYILKRETASSLRSVEYFFTYTNDHEPPYSNSRFTAPDCNNSKHQHHTSNQMRNYCWLIFFSFVFIHTRICTFIQCDAARCADIVLFFISPSWLAVACVPWLECHGNQKIGVICITLVERFAFFSSPTYSSSSSSCSFTCLSFRCFCFYLKRSHHFLRNENMFE